MESEHNTRLGARDTRAVCYTPTRDKQLAVERELFTTHLQTKFLPRDAMRYAFELGLHNFFDMPYLGNGLRWENLLPLLPKTGNCVFYPMELLLGDPRTNIYKKLSRDAMLARYILCDGPVLVRPSVWLGAEGTRDTKSCRGTRVVASSSMRPTATDAQLWRGRSIHAAYCYWGCGRTTGWPT